VRITLASGRTTDRRVITLSAMPMAMVKAGITPSAIITSRCVAARSARIAIIRLSTIDASPSVVSRIRLYASPAVPGSSLLMSLIARA
jgi:hypothetical protein